MIPTNARHVLICAYSSRVQNWLINGLVLRIFKCTLNLSLIAHACAHLSFTIVSYTLVPLLRMMRKVISPACGRSCIWKPLNGSSICVSTTCCSALDCALIQVIWAYWFFASCIFAKASHYILRSSSWVHFLLVHIRIIKMSFGIIRILGKCSLMINLRFHLIIKICMDFILRRTAPSNLATVMNFNWSIIWLCQAYTVFGALNAVKFSWEFGCIVPYTLMKRLRENWLVDLALVVCMSICWTLSHWRRRK